MIPPAEALLLTTGLIKLPDKTTIRAAQAVEREIAAEIKAAIARENPGRLYALQTPANYFERLVKFEADYADMIEQLGPELGGEFQLKQMEAQQELLKAYPRKTIDTVVGPRPVETSEIERALYNLVADTIEDYLRLVRDLAAGVLTRAQVDIFKLIYPETFSFIGMTVTDELIRYTSKDLEWLPPLWLSDAIKTLRSQKLEGFTRKAEAAPAENAPSFKLDQVIDATKL
jgi:hypothetical protein